MRRIGGSDEKKTQRRFLAPGDEGLDSLDHLKGDRNKRPGRHIASVVGNRPTGLRFGFWGNCHSVHHRNEHSIILRRDVSYEGH